MYFKALEFEGKRHKQNWNNLTTKTEVIFRSVLFIRWGSKIVFAPFILETKYVPTKLRIKYVWDKLNFYRICISVEHRYSVA